MNASRRLSHLRVLVVDDDKDTREMLRFILQQQAAAVVVAESVAEAVTAFDSFVPDVVLTDIGMPGYNGYALVALLRDHDNKTGRTTPAIALTAYTSTADKETALAAGFQVYISKP